MGVILADQMRIFLFSMVFGILAGTVFDLLTVTAKLFKHKKTWLYIFDTAYCVLCLISAVAFLFIEGEGQIEGYILFGMVAGAGIYFLSISNFCKRFIKKKTQFRTKK